jgi:uncharacterized iron-regulated membrane protein
MRVNLLQFFRKTHLYLGVFTAPAILFFALSGALQTFSLHEAARGSSYTPARWILVLAQIHKKQTAQVPQRKVPPQAVGTEVSIAKKKGDTAPPAQPQTPSVAPAQPPSGQAQPAARQLQHNALPLKIFFLIVALSLFASTATGLYLAWKYRRHRVVLAVLILGGILAPLLLMQL